MRPQRWLFRAEAPRGPTVVAQMGFYGQLATEGQALFRDADFVGAYCAETSAVTRSGPSCREENFRAIKRGLDTLRQAL